MAEPPEPIDEEPADSDVAVDGKAASPADGKGFPFWPLLAMAAFVSAGLGGYMSYAYYEDIAAAVEGTASADSTVGAAESERTYGQFSEIEDVVINPASSGGKRFLMLSIGLEAASTETLEEVTAKDVVVRDTLLKILGARSIEELSDITRRNELKATLRDALNGVLHEGEIERLYFTRYVLQ